MTGSGQWLIKKLFNSQATFRFIFQNLLQARQLCDIYETRNVVTHCAFNTNYAELFRYVKLHMDGVDEDGYKISQI